MTSLIHLPILLLPDLAPSLKCLTICHPTGAEWVTVAIDQLYDV